MANMGKMGVANWEGYVESWRTFIGKLCDNNPKCPNILGIYLPIPDKEDCIKLTEAIINMKSMIS